jgi:hypothetical protein
MIHAQILNGIVRNTIVIDDESLVPLFKVGFDDCKRIDHFQPRPGIGSIYSNGKFSPLISGDMDKEMSINVPHGTQIIFKPFIFSERSKSYPVSVENNILSIGCHQYDYPWTRYALWRIITKNDTQVGPLIKRKYGVSYEDMFLILQNDINDLYAALCTLV